LTFTGLAAHQVAAVVAEIGTVTAANPDAARYRPGAIL
jgi:adenylosuccinate lyase